MSIFDFNWWGQILIWNSFSNVVSIMKWKNFDAAYGLSAMFLAHLLLSGPIFDTKASRFIFSPENI